MQTSKNEHGYENKQFGHAHQNSLLTPSLPSPPSPPLHPHLPPPITTHNVYPQRCKPTKL